MYVALEESEESEPSEHPVYARVVFKQYISLPLSVVIGLFGSCNLSFGLGELNVFRRN